MAFNIAHFRALYTAFADTTKYPDVTLNMYATLAGEFMQDNGGMLTGTAFDAALEMLVAHMLTLAANAAAGKQGGFGTSSTVGSVSVGVQALPAKGMYDYYLGQTTYGQQLLTLLAIKAVGGLYIGGRPENAGFRKAEGAFSL